jgi:hypothetical protein
MVLRPGVGLTLRRWHSAEIPGPTLPLLAHELEAREVPA